MRVHPEDKKRWEKIAAEQGLSLSAWIEEQLNEEVFWHQAQKSEMKPLYKQYKHLRSD